MKDIFFHILFSILLISNISTIIIIPFQTYNPLITKNETLLVLIKNSSDKSIVDTISRNLIYTNLNLGKNIQTIPTFIEMFSKEFYVKEVSIHNTHKNMKATNSNFDYGNNYLLNSIFHINYYNLTKSVSYKFLTDCYDLILDFLAIKCLCCNESVYFIQKENINDKEIIKPIDIYVKFKEVEDFDHRAAIMGLNYYNNFLPELKQRNEIKSYDFSFNYVNAIEEKGELIIGDLPHIYYSKNYEEKNLRTAKINKDDPLIKWSINFDIYISAQNKDKNEYHLEIDDIALFYIEQFFITGSHKYMNYIEENFFRKYIERKICKRSTHNKPYYEEHFVYFICNIDDDNRRKEFFNEFPPLIFHQKEMYYNFTLNAEDLFTIIPDGKRILFNVDFIINSNKWILGKPFFKKYQLIFNSDSNLISYYI